MNPRDIKYQLAEELVSRFHDKDAAAKAQQDFIARYRHGATPEEMDERMFTSAEPALNIAPILRDAGLTSSSSEATRMVNQGAFRFNGERVDDPKFMVPVDGTSNVYQVGKRRFARVTLTPAKD